MNAGPDLVPELDELTITIVVDNATDTLSSIDPGIPQLPEAWLGRRFGFTSGLIETRRP